MKYELINPSDAVFFEAPSLLIAALSVVYLSSKYGAKQIDGDSNVPIFMFGGCSEWFKEKLNVENIQKSFDENKKEVARCLNTFHMNGERTSMNDICKYAHEDAESLLDPEKPND